MPSSADPYQIRLRGPWQVAWLGSGPPAEEQPTFDTVYLPESWKELFGAAPGRALFRRRFNRPTNLAPDERVVIVLTDVPGEVVLRCNTHEITAAGASGPQQRYDVTEHLRDFNLLEVEITCDPTAVPQTMAGLWQTVLLEIRPAARL
ncbi:MAG: hypothetical protein DWQ34_26640 [Planctomycetota bacterium]|nr:MAG: hypothetical protein DWQ29_18120 [Planctomycetota bacterium]REJ86859.1 MAG: hypothetical protein DWQ34_26640 [Planctomycetota bacterium]REK22798.1 MAG: hypothetical protein DWQ41_18545 [Planctomycetota bacterium]REK33782.1 MAG: hypothetical protein DWQ45_14450 [Planctomycetota bacterium]